MEGKINLLRPKDIAKLYDIPLKTVYELLSIDSCPIIKGGGGKHYLIEKSAFEKWLKNS